MKFEGFFQWCRAFRRSRKGAWIEISRYCSTFLTCAVAPARERGLKFSCSAADARRISRSREGAWIEIMHPSIYIDDCDCRSREGAWIEMV